MIIIKRLGKPHPPIITMYSNMHVLIDFNTIRQSVMSALQTFRGRGIGICKIHCNLFHTPKAHTNQHYIPKHSVTFNSCPIELKFAHFEAISILHTMSSQRRSQSSAASASPTSQRSQETDDPRLGRLYDGFKCANSGSIGHELRVLGDILLVCMWFRCVLHIPIAFLPDAIVQHLSPMSMVSSFLNQ